MKISNEIQKQAVRELPLDCKGQKKCSQMSFFQIECQCECYQSNIIRLLNEKKNGHKRTSAA